MVNDSRPPSSIDADELQDVQLPELPAGASGFVPSTPGDRYFTLRAMRVHNRHVQAHRVLNEGVPRAEQKPVGCSCLREGMAGVTTPPEEARRPTRGVAEGDGADGGEGAALPPDRRSGRGRGQLSW